MRPLAVMLTDRARKALDRRITTEDLNASTITCRALQVYDHIQSRLEDGLEEVVFINKITGEHRTLSRID